ncbi:hypothetical protein KKH81_02945 [Patescibacteria group bacterium]|nr:hypothetical protein [Patescibacteria group bacterium]
MTDSVTLDAAATPSFVYYPTGDASSCTVTAQYTNGKQSVTHGWKNAIEPGDSGAATFGATSPKGILTSVSVTCKNRTYSATDRIAVSVPTSGSAEYKILIGNSGQRTYKKGTGSEAEAKVLCSQAYNDPKIHKFTRVQCYWDGAKFMDVDAFKG